MMAGWRQGRNGWTRRMGLAAAIAGCLGIAAASAQDAK